MRKGFLYRALQAIIVLILSNSVYSFDIVKDGQPAAVIVVADTSENPKVIEYAANELQYHIQKATGAVLEIVKESELPKIKQKYKSCIYLGSCRATIESGVDASKLLPNSFIVKTSDSNLFMAGKDGGTDSPLNDHVDMGTLFAVYEFLEKQMGVCWLWPGKLGEFIPQRKDVLSGQWNHTEIPQLIQRFWILDAPVNYGREGWSSETNLYNYTVDVYRWARRHRFIRSHTLDYGEAFNQHNGDYWNRFGKTHPEYFNLLPNGKREPDPKHPYHFAMCESEPGLWKQMVEDWAKNRTEKLPWVNCNPNDTPGKCVCERCLAWDVPRPEDNVSLELARKAFLAQDNDGQSWTKYLGSLSDRYAKYLLGVQKEAQKVDPNATVSMYAYMNYTRPPIKTKLNDHVVISLANYLSFPYDDETSREFRDDWGGWSATGARLIFRPNITYGTHNMPIHYAKRAGEDIQYAFNHGIIATYLDCLTGMWAAQGPSLYVVARTQLRYDKPVDAIFDEYYQAFGPAADAVKSYFEHWRTVTESMTREKWQQIVDKYDMKDSDGLNFRTFYKAAHLIYTPDVMARGKELLNIAAEKAKGDTLAEQRVAFLKKGFEDALLTLLTQKAYEQYQKTGDSATFASALQRLDDYRRSIEADYAVNMSYVRMQENNTWDREFVKIMNMPGKLPMNEWKFMFDLQEQGESGQWYQVQYDDTNWFSVTTNGPWESQEVGKKWKQDHGSDYDGTAWYRCKFDIDTGSKNKKCVILFMAVDEACTVWLNGKQLLTRPYPYKGDGESWRKPFEVDATDAIDFEKPNVLCIKVEDKLGVGGIWKPVYLVTK
ncbi:MAG: DUF4838 domain-containing protein [Sedimentisphaerales bacterium]